MKPRSRQPWLGRHLCTPSKPPCSNVKENENRPFVKSMMPQRLKDPDDSSTGLESGLLSRGCMLRGLMPTGFGDRVFTPRPAPLQIAKAESTGETALVEVGPRFCLQLHRIFAGAFQGSTLYSNSSYVRALSPPNHSKSEKRHFLNRGSFTRGRCVVISTKVAAVGHGTAGYHTVR
jgi:hypothetical protein